jgi:hypothetical protein
MNEEKTIASVEAWPANPIDQYTAIDSGPWGYLTVCSNGETTFSQDSVPTRAEILERWGSWLPGESPPGD